MSSVRAAGQPRVVVQLPQCPFDPTSGAAQSMRYAAEHLAAAGCSVVGIGTTGCEGPLGRLSPDTLRSAGFRVLPGSQLNWLLVESAGVQWHLADLPEGRERSWRVLAGSAVLELAASLCVSGTDVFLSFGDERLEAELRSRFRASGARVVFALHSVALCDRPCPTEVDAWWAPSRFLAERVGKALGVEPFVAAPPCIRAVPEPASPDGRYAVVAFNPEPAKGGAMVAVLAERLARRAPATPFVIVLGRQTAADYAKLHRSVTGGDPRQLASLLFVQPTLDLRAVWKMARVVLVPSIVEEAAGRVALEAWLHGARPLVSDCGGLPEMVGDHGDVLTPPALDLSRAECSPSEPVVADWERTVLGWLADDRSFALHVERSRTAALHHVSHTGPAWLAELLLGRQFPY